MRKQILFLCVALLFPASPHLFADSTLPWEQHPEGVATAITFESTNQNGTQRNVISVYMKNTSATSTYYVGTEGFHTVVPLFIVNADKETPLRDYNWPGGSAVLCPEIKPGETLTRTIDISEQELALIKDHPIKCRLYFLNIDTAASKVTKHYVIDSVPEVLVKGP